MKIKTVLTVSLASAFLVGCGSGDNAASDSDPQGAGTPRMSSSAPPSPSAAESPEMDAKEIAARLVASIDSAEKITVITEDNDPNELIGRPGGYVSAAVIHDQGGDQSSSEPGVAYGATVEVYEDEAGAQRRFDYIQGILEDSPILGTEYGYVRGAVLLRVSGEIKPSVASKYEEVFAAQ